VGRTGTLRQAFCRHLHPCAAAARADAQGVLPHHYLPRPHSLSRRLYRPHYLTSIHTFTGSLWTVATCLVTASLPMTVALRGKLFYRITRARFWRTVDLRHDTDGRTQFSVFVVQFLRLTFARAYRNDSPAHTTHPTGHTVGAYSSHMQGAFCGAHTAPAHDPVNPPTRIRRPLTRCLLDRRTTYPPGSRPSLCNLQHLMNS